MEVEIVLHDGPKGRQFTVLVGPHNFWYMVKQHGTRLITFSRDEWSGAIACYENLIGRSVPASVRPAIVRKEGVAA